MAEKSAMPQLPKFDVAMPKVDGAAWLSLYDANVETMLAVQKVVLDYARHVAGKNVAFLESAHGKTVAAMKGGVDAKKQPQAYADEAKATFEQVAADAKATVEAGIKAHGEVVSLLGKRAQANLEQLKSFAA